MRLKRLALQGFKTFAARTEFELEAGITAIVGPNGSGKSNLADAVRWALGEQSGRHLRIKKLEDVIFAGGNGRAPTGMAEVCLTFDNANRRIPLDFGEVSITRRTYRSGESEYLINGSRVRLRDVGDLLLRANVGHNGYTVIGQGMVDAVLSLRPEDRRGLLEEAADVRHLQIRLAETRDKLAQTLDNLARAHDLLAELAPRLDQLAAQAERARAHAELSVQLQAALAHWYGMQRQRIDLGQARARTNLAEATARVEARRRTVEDLAARLDDEERRGRAATDRLAELRRQVTAIAAEADRLAGQVAGDEERLALLRRQEGEATSAAEALVRRLGAEREQAEAAAEALQQIEAEQAVAAGVQERSRAAAEGAAAGVAEGRARLKAAIDRANARLGEAETIRRRLAALERRVTELAGQSQESQDSRLPELDRQLAEADEVVGACRRELARLEADLASHRHAQALARERIELLERRLAEERRERDALAVRLDLLNRLEATHEGIPPGARAVLEAAPKLGGIFGTVASALQVPSEYELAIEVALGGHVHDVIVETWRDAERAIEFLKARRAGRATFLPLDTIRPSSRGPLLSTLGGQQSAISYQRLATSGQRSAPGTWPPAPSPEHPGPNSPSSVVRRPSSVVGAAADLVTFEARFGAVVGLLLGGTLVVADLETARGLLGPGLRASQIVTLGGEVVRPGGSVTGGSLRGDGGTGGRGDAGTRGHGDHPPVSASPRPPVSPSLHLARERERRELPADLARRDEQLRSLGQEVERERTIARTHTIAGGETEARLGGERRRLSEGEKRLASLERERDRLQQAEAFAREMARRRADELRLLAEQQAELAGRLDALEDDEQSSDETIDTLKAGLTRAIDELDGVRRELLAHAARSAELEVRRREALMAWSSHRASLDEVAGQLEGSRGRIDQLGRERRQLDEEVARRRTRLAELAARQARLRSALDPLEAEERGRRERLDEERGALNAAERELFALEQARGQASLEVERWEGDLRTLRSRMEADGIAPNEPDGPAQLRLWEPAREDDRSTPLQPPGGVGRVLPARATASGAPATAGLEPPGNVEGARRRIDRLRAQIRALGLINAEAPAEHEALRTRCDFLTQQTADLRAAERELRGAIGELEALSRQRFEATFQAVNAEFRRCFAILFGGGTARLVLADADGDPRPEGAGPPAGVEIVAQPPGKRLNDLAALSGGERALTAVALIFALLHVSPTPFCVLDEVDAALDEANVGRFGAMLRHLATGSQFIVITHNRATMELADALYGVTMGSDAASRVLSLRLA